MARTTAALFVSIEELVKKKRENPVCYVIPPSSEIISLSLKDYHAHGQKMGEETATILKFSDEDDGP